MNRPHSPKTTCAGRRAPQGPRSRRAPRVALPSPPTAPERLVEWFWVIEGLDGDDGRRLPEEEI
jgi:hypothetical protein